jgi:hypothetical protein
MFFIPDPELAEECWVIQQVRDMDLLKIKRPFGALDCEKYALRSGRCLVHDRAWGLVLHLRRWVSISTKRIVKVICAVILYLGTI